jgi:hypothetical protein
MYNNLPPLSSMSAEDNNLPSLFSMSAEVNNLSPLSSMSAKSLGQDPSAPEALETYRDPQKQIINY